MYIIKFLPFPVRHSAVLLDQQDLWVTKGILFISITLTIILVVSYKISWPFVSFFTVSLVSIQELEAWGQSDWEADNEGLKSEQGFPEIISTTFICFAWVLNNLCWNTHSILYRNLKKTKWLIIFIRKKVIQSGDEEFHAYVVLKYSRSSL